MNILLIEDHSGLALNIFDYFESKGYQIDWARDGQHGYELAITQNHDLIILDIMLPKINGFELCKKVRYEHDLEVPIIMLTAKKGLDDKILGFHLGIDDYLVKPFELKELEARIKAVTKRSNGLNTNKVLSYLDLQVTPKTFEVIRGGRPLKLPPITFKILCLILKNKHRVTTFSEIESYVWAGSTPSSSSLRTHIHTLRSIIEKPFASKIIVTIPKVGLRLIDEVNI